MYGQADVTKTFSGKLYLHQIVSCRPY